MDANEYQTLCRKTGKAPYGSGTVEAANLGVVELCDEAGEVAGVWKKRVLRTERLSEVAGDYTNNLPPSTIEQMKLEIGDVLWAATMACDELNLTLSEVMQANIDKLQARHGVSQ